MGEGRRTELLMVEDNPGDVELTREVLDGMQPSSRLHPVSSGEQALAFLRRQPPFESAPRPDLVLLDLNLPGMRGLEVLRAIRQDADLTALPVVILSSSRAEADVEAAYREHVNCFVTKPLGLDDFENVVRSIAGFWFGIATRV